jgi:hypothetical protein
MTDITTRLRTAIGEEPPIGFGAADVVAAGRKARRRRRAAYSAVAAGAAATAVGATLVVTGPAGTTPAPKFTLDALIAAASHGEPSGTPGIISQAFTPRLDHGADGLAAAGIIKISPLAFTQIPELVRTDTGASLTAWPSKGWASSHRTISEMNIFSALATPGHPSLDIMLMPPGTISAKVTTATCSTPVPADGGGDYQGPCSVTRLADGATLVVLSGKSPRGYAITLAALIRPDGSVVIVDDKNQAQPSGTPNVLDKTPGGAASAKAVPQAQEPPIVSVDPPVSAKTLGKLVQDLAARI